MAKNSLMCFAPLIRGVAPHLPNAAGGFSVRKTPRSLHSRPPYQGVNNKKTIHHCVSTISQRTRTSATAMLYIQKASAISSIPVSMVAAMLGALVKLIEAP